MNKKLDARDEQIVALLRANARLPLATLAKKIHLSRSATQERLARLQSSGVITGYTVQLGADAASRAWLMLRYKPGTQCAALAPQMQKLREVRVCHSLAGAVDMLLLIEAESAEALTAVRQKIAAIDGIAEVTTAPVMKVHFGS